MRLKDKEVIRYTLDSFGMITKIELLPKRKYPELVNYLEPPDQMIEDGLLDEYERPCWLHRDGQIRKVDLGEPTPVEDAQKFVQELTRVEMLKLIFKGIENKNDSDYQAFVDKVNLL